VVKVTITTFYIHTSLNIFKIIILGQFRLIGLISVEGQPTKAVLAQICMGVVFIQVSDTSFVMIFLPKQTAIRRRPPVVRGPQCDIHYNPGSRY
jgi:hypothetical protein